LPGESRAASQGSSIRALSISHSEALAGRYRARTRLRRRFNQRFTTLVGHARAANRHRGVTEQRITHARLVRLPQMAGETFLESFESGGGRGFGRGAFPAIDQSGRSRKIFPAILEDSE
jgi:hypothetical protein